MQHAFVESEMLNEKIRNIVPGDSLYITKYHSGSSSPELDLRPNSYSHVSIHVALRAYSNLCCLPSSTSCELFVVARDSLLGVPNSRFCLLTSAS